MKKNRFQKIMEVAYVIRRVFEEIEKEEYKPYNLGGYCSRASEQLHAACERLGLKGVELWCGYGHAYNVYDGKIIDITATQFNSKRPKVYCISHKYACRRYEEYGKHGSCFEGTYSQLGSDFIKDLQKVNEALGIIYEK